MDAIRDEVLASLGEEDAAYIRRIIRMQRRLDIGGRALLMAGVLPPAWLAGVGMLSLAKILENMEIGHNVLHAQWDWMRDPEIHSTSWEWDNVCPSSQWKHTHNHIHHQWTNVAGMDRDIGYGVFRVAPVAEVAPLPAGPAGDLRRAGHVLRVRDRLPRPRVRPAVGRAADVEEGRSRR